MQNLGKKEKSSKLYPSMSDEGKKNRVTYPNISLPLDIYRDGKIGDKVEIKLVGEIVGMQDTKWSQTIDFECHEGEVTSKSKGSVIDEAK